MLEKQEALLGKYLPMTETMFLTLFSLQEPRHGYAIMTRIKELTNQRVNLGNGTLYGNLAKMQKDGVIKLVHEEEQRKIYQITELGQIVLNAESRRLKELNQIIMEGE
ncbi:PadR family transcriptional regulator [Vagococcus intermedius]|uniref:PadR family transcriptional regulator n=1 Tax=Vagococcus intermedius TaxID=2991418 RepID=A0AAF0I911_9ENTE|nr:PadR family transcriptional regulator [Vagococcus intermedius]WEG73037.1 PadR family transcriptional regulator [Vagococcus intermedius]WEG75122.1 PadR family transcriptional regulator [Vagococcus intermedius]